jgi:hypothetical protein
MRTHLRTAAAVSLFRFFSLSTSRVQFHSIYCYD